MADFILARKSRNLLGSLVHGLLNLLLGIFSVAITVTSGSPAIGLILIVLSKWRIFAVRPRFWWLNIKSNLVDLVVGFSVVLLTFFAGTAWLPVHFLLMGFFILWLVLIKPLSSPQGTIAQALAALFLGSNLAVIMGSTLDSSITVAIVFVAGYAASRHVLVQESEPNNFAFASLVCGLIAAELSWICHAWNIVYTFQGTGIVISQLSAILLVIGFLFFYVRASLARHDGHLKASAVTLPIICGLLIVAILIFGFSEPFFNI